MKFEKILILFALMLIIPIGVQGALTLTPASDTDIYKSVGVTTHATLGATDLTYSTTDDMNCTFSGTLLSTTVVNNDTASPDQEFNTTPNINTLLPACYTISVTCENATDSLSDTNTGICLRYEANRTVDDLPAMAIDLAGSALYAVIGFITLIVLIGVFVFMKVKGKKLTKW